MRIKNSVKALDKKIDEDKKETRDILENGFPCIREQCYLGRLGLCGLRGKRWMKECEWDLCSKVFDVHGKDEEERIVKEAKKHPEKKKWLRKALH